MSEEKKNNRSGNKIIDITKATKIRPITISPEELEDPEIDEMIRESIRQEADRLEEELNNDPELMGVGASDDMFLSIVSRLKEQGVWEEEDQAEKEDELPDSVDDDEEAEENDVNSVDNLSGNEESCVKQDDIYRMLPEEDLQALMLGREVARQKEEKKVRRQRQRRHVRRIASVAAVFVVVFMVGMTSEANRRLVLKAWDAVMTVAGFNIDTDYAESEKVVREEDEEERLAWNDAAEKLGISALAFMYLPEGMIFEQYEVVEEMMFAIFMYAYQDRIINVKVTDVKDESSMYYILDEDAEIEETIIADKNVKVEIWKVDSGLIQSMYTAEFEYNECRYLISGVISLDEIKKIIKNMFFL